MRKLSLISLSIILAACQTVTRPGTAIGPNGPVSPEQYLGGLGGLTLGVPQQSESPFERFETSFKESYGAPKDSAKAEDMMLAGFSFSELICDRYFNILANGNQDLNFSTESVSIFSGVTAAVLGLTGSPAKSVALVATGFSATIAQLESFQQHYYFGPDVSTVRKLITDGMDSYRAAAQAQGTSKLTYYSALAHVQKMQSICQVDSIQSYVDQAVASQKLVFKAEAREDLFRSVTLSLQDELSEKLGTSQTISTQNIMYLYMLMTGESTAGFNIKKIRQGFEDIGLAGVVEPDGKFVRSKLKNLAEVQMLLENLPLETRQLFRLQFEDMLVQFRAEEAAAAAKAKEGPPDPAATPPDAAPVARLPGMDGIAAPEITGILQPL